MKRLCVVVLAWFLCGASAAHAANVSKVNNTLVIAAGAGETNKITVTKTSTLITVADTGHSLTASNGCLLVAGTARCTGTTWTGGTVTLSDGNDEFYADTVANVKFTVDGGAGNDTLLGGQVEDTLTGGDGDDTWLAGADLGRDVFNGGLGTDTASYAAATAPVTVAVDQFDMDGPKPSGFLVDNVRTDVEVVVGGSANDILIANRTAGTRLVGGDGDDTLIGGNGDDVLEGEAGQDALAGGTGSDRLTGGPDRDRLFTVAGGTDTITATDGTADSIECTGAAAVASDASDEVDGACSGGAPTPPSPSISVTEPTIDTSCSDPVNQDGSLTVNTTLTPLGAPVPGQPVLPRESVGGTERQPVGLNDNTDQPWGNPLGTDLESAQIVLGIGSHNIRRDFGWWDAWPVEANPICLSYHDAAYRTFTENGIRPLFTVNETPRWASSHPEEDTCANNGLNGNGFCQSLPKLAALNKFAGLMAVLARRYPLAAGFEIHNEPNLQEFTQGPDPALYASVVRAARIGADAGRAGTRVVAFAVGQQPWNPTTSDMGSVSFVARALHDGALGNYDAAAFHPYPGSAGIQTLFRGSTSMFEQTLAAYGDSTARLLATEVGVLGDLSDTNTQGVQRDVLWNTYRDLVDGVAGDSALSAVLARVDAIWMHVSMEASSAYKWGWTVRATGGVTTMPVFCKFRIDYGGIGGTCPQTLQTG